MSIDSQSFYDQLPIETRTLLDVQAPRVQHEVLVVLASLVTSWETDGAWFDPIQWDLVVNSLAQVLVDLTAQLRDEKTLIEIMLGPVQ